MKMSLFTKNGTDWTRFRLAKSEILSVPGLAIMAYCRQKVKESKRYVWYEAEGDFLNGNFKESEVEHQ